MDDRWSKLFSRPLSSSRGAGAASGEPATDPAANPAASTLPQESAEVVPAPALPAQAPPQQATTAFGPGKTVAIPPQSSEPVTRRSEAPLTAALRPTGTVVVRPAAVSAPSAAPLAEPAHAPSAPSAHAPSAPSAHAPSDSMARFTSTQVVSPQAGPRPAPPAPFVRQHQTLILSGKPQQAPSSDSRAFAPTLAPDGSFMAPVQPTAPASSHAAQAAAFAPTMAPDGSHMAPGSLQPPSSTLRSDNAPPPSYTPPLQSEHGPLTEPRPSADEERALVDFDLWCKRVAFGIMDSMYGGAKEQAALLERATGLRVDVVYPAQPPVDLMHAASELQFMSLTLAPFEAFVYSARNPGKPPILHLLSATEQLPHSGRPTLDVVQMAKRRVTSTPVCRVAVPRDGVGYMLVEPRSPTERVRQEEILQRVFAELVRRHKSRG